MDGRDLHTIGAMPETDNVVRKARWLENHPRDVIRFAESNRWGFWHECIRDGRQLVEASDLGLLMNRLEADFDTDGSREP